MKIIIGNEAMCFPFLKQSIRLTDNEKQIYEKLTQVGQRGESMYAMSADLLIASLTEVGLFVPIRNREMVSVIFPFELMMPISEL